MSRTCPSPSYPFWSICGHPDLGYVQLRDSRQSWLPSLLPSPLSKIILQICIWRTHYQPPLIPASAFPSTIPTDATVLVPANQAKISVLSDLPLVEESTASSGLSDSRHLPELQTVWDYPKVTNKVATGKMGSLG